MGLISELGELGVNTNDAMQRFMGNEALYERMLKKLPPVVAQQEVMKYLEEGDYETALVNAHTLKGVMGNLSVTPLFDAYTDIVAFLRENAPEKAKERMQGVLDVQEKVVACIDKYK